MEKNVTLIPFSHILSMAPDLKHYGNDIILTNENSKPELFKYPFKLNGAFVGIQLEGTFSVSINLRNLELKPNQLFICSPGDILQFISQEVKKAKAIAFSFDFLSGLNLKMKIKDLITDLMMTREMPVLDLTDENMRDLDGIFRLIEKNMEHPSVYQAELLQNLISTYVYTVGKILNEHKYRLLEQRKIAPQRDMAMFFRFLDLLSEYHQSERSVGFYAEKLFFSPKYFSFLVKRISGHNVTEWINNYVILEAKSLLKHSDKTIQEVAYVLNFPNASFFGKYFKHHTGMTPGEYKES